MSDKYDDGLVVKRQKFETTDGRCEAVATKLVKNEGGNAVKKMMENMGFVEGQGLGRNKQGIVEAISVDASMGRSGLGHANRKNNIYDPNLQWDESVEQKTVEETVEYVECPESIREFIRGELNHRWICVDKPITTLWNANDFCDNEVVNGVIEAKAVFDGMNDYDLREARKRANPYEKIMGAIFQNRAAMKTANLDRVFDWRLSREFEAEKRQRKNPRNNFNDRENTTRDDKMFYFADVCAGPGGFSEYMIWRKSYYNVKGFGFTLRGNDDFKLQQFRAGSAAYFETYYGVQNDGDVTVPENLTALADYVDKRTNGRRCHLVMCDGGFSVQGKEEIQEILSKRLYLCQFIVGLSLCRVGDGTSGSGGNFLCKLFDVFTPFSAGLIYLMYSAFEKISLHKPHTSRPANSERYIFCENLTPFGATVIQKYFTHINNEMEKLSKSKDEDVIEVFPLEEIKNDQVFHEYYCKHIESFAHRQIVYLNKYREFGRNKGVFDSDQMDLRKNCLEYWEVPDGQRSKKDDEERGKPGILTLKSLLRNQRYEIERIHRFSLTGESWNEVVKQVRLVEQIGVLMPEYNHPTLLFSNNQSRAFICRAPGQCDEMNGLVLPPNTLLLIQETKVYKKLGQDLVPDRTFSNVIYVVDAGLLSGDDVSSLDYALRIRAIRKFCRAINRGLESIKADTAPRSDVNHNRRSYNHNPPRASFYFHSADPTELRNLDDRFNDYNPAFLADKCKPIAVRKFTFPVEIGAPDETRYWPCQSVRIVQRFKADIQCCWSVSNSKLFYFNSSNGKNSMECASEFFASFYDQIPLTENAKSKPVVWTWSWQVDSKVGYTPKEILNDEKHPNYLTVRFLTAAIDERRAKYDPRVFDEVPAFDYRDLE